MPSLLTPKIALHLLSSAVAVTVAVPTHVRSQLNSRSVKWVKPDWKGDLSDLAILGHSQSRPLVYIPAALNAGLFLTPYHRPHRRGRTFIFNSATAKRALGARKREQTGRFHANFSRVEEGRALWCLWKGWLRRCIPIFAIGEAIVLRIFDSDEIYFL